MRYYLVPLLLFVPAITFAEEAVATAADAADATNWPLYIITGVVLPFVITYLRRKAAEAAKKAEQAELNNGYLVNDIRNSFIDQRLIPFLYEASAHITEMNLPTIMQDALDGDGFDWKKHLGDLKDELLVLTKEKFSAEGIDIVAKLGEKYLDSLLERALLKAMPYLPQVVKTVGEKSGDELTKKIARMICTWGASYAKERWAN